MWGLLGGDRGSWSAAVRRLREQYFDSGRGLRPEGSRRRRRGRGRQLSRWRGRRRLWRRRGSSDRPTRPSLWCSGTPHWSWEMAAKHERARVTHQPVSSRDDVYQLQERLDAELIERQARPYGICPVRELLYSQSFDELLRQVTIESPERGLMMLRVRDQLRMTIAVYQTLFQQSTVFGTRRAVMAETMMSASKTRGQLKAHNGKLRHKCTTCRTSLMWWRSVR